jgi:hypothetical protein
MLSRHLHPVAIVENVAIEAQCLFDLGIPGIALLGSAPALLAAPPLGFRIGEHVTHRLCQGLDHCLRTIERNGTADTVVHHLCRPSIGNGADCPRRGHRLKQDSASRFTHRGQAENGPVTGVLQYRSILVLSLPSSPETAEGSIHCSEPYVGCSDAPDTVAGHMYRPLYSPSKIRTHAAACGGGWEKATPL